MERPVSDKIDLMNDADGDRPADSFAPGSVDGKVVMLTLEEAAKLVGERDADEEAFDKVLDGMNAEAIEEDDDLSDLDDELPAEESELDEHL